MFNVIFRKERSEMKRNLIVLWLLGFVVFGCVNFKKGTNGVDLIDRLQIENDSLRDVLNKTGIVMDQKIVTFLTFQKDDAESAMRFYVELFDNSEVVELKRWGKEGPGKEGTVMQATFNLNGKLFMCSDSPPVHDWDFTPAVSNFVVCSDEAEINKLFERLSEKGSIAMPLNNYGFSRRFGWVIDQFGISWQLNLR